MSNFMYLIAMLVLFIGTGGLIVMGLDGAQLIYVALWTIGYGGLMAGSAHFQAKER